MTQPDVIIGKIVKSNSHVDYVCQVFGPGDREQEPGPDDRAFGRFVRIATAGDDQPDLIGIIYNTLLMNPEFGSLGPRLSTQADLRVFSPDYLNEQLTLVGILVAGSLPKKPDGLGFQGIPPVSAQVDALVSVLSQEEICRFHRGADGPRLAYLPHLLSQGNPLIPHLLLNVLEQVSLCFPQQVAALAVLRDNLAWRAQVEQTG